jgi:hypothetical protein
VCCFFFVSSGGKFLVYEIFLGIEGGCVFGFGCFLVWVLVVIAVTSCWGLFLRVFIFLGLELVLRDSIAQQCLEDHVDCWFLVCFVSRAVGYDADCHKLPWSNACVFLQKCSMGFRGLHVTVPLA